MIALIVGPSVVAILLWMIFVHPHTFYYGDGE